MTGSDAAPRLRLLVLQHISCETPGEYAEVLAERGGELETVELDEGGPLPDWREFDGILAMGGPMSVNDEAELPWLALEKGLIRAAVEAGKPYFGACLGVQLLASSLGARVYPGPMPEVGLMPVELTEAAHQDPLFAGAPRSLMTLQWHQDTFDLPAGAVRLAGSEAFPNQAFRWGDAAYGIQFHLEVSPEMARAWAEIPAYAQALERVLGKGGLDSLVSDLETGGAGIRRWGRTVFGRWLDLVAARRGSLAQA